MPSPSTAKTGVLALAFGPATVSAPIHTRELVVLLVGVTVTMATNVVLVRRAFAPLRRLTRLMHTVDPLAPGTRLHADGAAKDVQELAEAFNAMLERLEDERRDSARRALRAQEAERRRLARELHDELGQSLTGVLLQIVRRLARDLRPDLLVELGLVSALNALALRLTRNAGLVVDRRLDPDLAALGDDAETVLYRVAQEALTNVARHAGATRVSIELTRVNGAVRLTIHDDGRGIPAYVGPDARGITGMRERALLVRGRIAVGRGLVRGTRVRLEVPDA